MDYIHFNESEGLKVGMSTTLDAIFQNNEVKRYYPSLIQAISVTASPQLRNRGTLGGNLNQASRCWYYRGPFHCWLKGGKTCFARDGENQHHAIFSGGPCFTVLPSDLAIVLTALKANLTIAGPQGKRKIRLEDFFQIPHEGSRSLTVLSSNEIVTEVSMPVPEPDDRSLYLKAMERRVWSFALASVAMVINMDKNLMKRASIILGGVAAKPWRLGAVEEKLSGHNLDESLIDAASESAIEGAQPLGKNAYKVPLVEGIVEEALTSLLVQP